MEKNFKWPISSSITIDASISTIWEAITAPGNLNDCHPFCKKNTVVNWSENNSKDIILYYNGRELERNFFDWKKEKGYKLMIGRSGGRQTEVHWEIDPIEISGKEKCVLRITLFVPHLQNTSVLIRWIPHFFYVRPRMKKYLDSVLQGFKFFIKTGKPVERNQFGSHSWFSSKTG
jgi:hypothetical protein